MVIYRDMTWYKWRIAILRQDGWLVGCIFPPTGGISGQPDVVLLNGYPVLVYIDGSVEAVKAQWLIPPSD